MIDKTITRNYAVCYTITKNETGLPYQTLINLYLKDCANKKLTLEFSPR